jgi:hypothetical protein
MLQCVVAKLAPPCCSVPGVALNRPMLLNHGSNSNTFTDVFANRTTTDCRATASVARQAKRLPYKNDSRSLLCAFFERRRFTAQIGENFAGEMQRAGDQDRIRFRPRKHQRVANG